VQLKKISLAAAIFMKVPKLPDFPTLGEYNYVLDNS
jgi:hypothetical protein